MVEEILIVIFQFAEGVWPDFHKKVSVVLSIITAAMMNSACIVLLSNITHHLVLSYASRNLNGSFDYLCRLKSSNLT